MTRLGIVGSGGVGGRGDGARAIGLIDLVAAEGPRALRGSWGLHGEVGDVGAGSPGGNLARWGHVGVRRHVDAVEDEAARPKMRRDSEVLWRDLFEKLGFDGSILPLLMCPNGRW